MKRLLLQVICFTLPIILFLIGVEYTLRQTPNEYNSKAQYLQQHANEIECLVLGSSHTLYGVQPAFFSMPTFNAAHNSQSLLYDDWILKKYEQQMDKLQYIIIPISYWTLTGTLETGIEKWKVKEYVLYYDFPTTNPLQYWDLFPLNYQTWKRFVKTLFVRDRYDIAIDKFGWGNRCVLANRSEDWKNSGAVAAARHTHFEGKEDIIAENMTALNDILQIANRHQAKVLLLNTPTHAVYREHLDVRQLQHMNHICDSLVDAHNHVYRLDYFADTTFVDDDFYDADHLNEYGAERLSKYINDTIQNLTHAK